jgi:hypothetical protein
VYVVLVWVGLQVAVDADWVDEGEFAEGCFPALEGGAFDGSVEEVEVLAARLHSVNHELMAAVEAEYHDLEESAGGVEPEAQLPGRAVFIQVADVHGMLGGMDGLILSATPCLPAESWTFKRRRNGWPPGSPPSD